MSKISIKENDISDAAKVLLTISEFEDSYTEELLREELKGNKFLVIVSYVDENPAGCVVSFDRFHDGSFYCWLVGVNPKFRGLGLLPLMMEYQERWAKSNQFKTIKIKTRNDSRKMLNYLVKDNFDILDAYSPKNTQKGIIVKYSNFIVLKLISILSRFLRFNPVDLKKNRIWLEKRL